MTNTPENPIVIAARDGAKRDPGSRWPAANLEVLVARQRFGSERRGYGRCGGPTRPSSARPWTVQQIRNFLIDLGERAADFRFLVRDRAGQFTEAFDAVLADAGIEAVKIPTSEPGR